MSKKKPDFIYKITIDRKDQSEKPDSERYMIPHQQFERYSEEDLTAEEVIEIMTMLAARRRQKYYESQR